MKFGRFLITLLLFLGLFAGTAAAAKKAEYHVENANKARFQKLFKRLQSAYEKPSAADEEEIEKLLTAIQKKSQDDYDIALSVSEHWKAVLLNPQYRLFIYRGEEKATTLERSMPVFSDRHAFVILGYQLVNGEMTDELKGRCDAAAAAARSWPEAILICSGGATGNNNPEKHTEARLMKHYLVRSCGIDASRILIDEESLTTLDNAKNVFRILLEKQIETITIVTSDYHQQWGQVLYNAMAAICEKRDGFSVRIVGNYNWASGNELSSSSGIRIALTQLGYLLDIK